MRKRKVATYAIAVVLTAGVLTAKAMEKTVVVQDGENKVSYMTRRGSVEDFLEEKKIVLGKEDELNVDLKTTLSKITTLVIERAINVTLVIDEETKEVKTCADTLGELLQEQNITLGEKDVIENGVHKDTSLTEGQKITIHKYREEIVKETKAIPFAVEKQNSDELERGKVSVVQEGKDGIEEQTIQVAYIGDQEVGRKVMETKRIQEPVKRIEKVGTAMMISTSRGMVRVKKQYTMRATAYTSSYQDTGKRPGDPGFGITASGMKARVGVVAVDPRVIPLGTRLYIEGYGYAVAGDTGGAIKGNKIDLYFNTLKEAKQFGVKTRQVYVLH